VRRKSFLFFAILILVCATTASAFAAKERFKGDTLFRIGSLIADGGLAGLGQEDETVILEASGIPVVTCTNQGGNQAPGQNPPKVSAQGKQYLAYETYDKNGSVNFSVETKDPAVQSGKKMGCPNNTWKPTIDFVFWTEATIRVVRTDTNLEVLKQNFACMTTRFPEGVICVPTH
jgi:hypothetical protein